MEFDEIQSDEEGWFLGWLKRHLYYLGNSFETLLAFVNDIVQISFLCCPFNDLRKFSIGRLTILSKMEFVIEHETTMILVQCYTTATDIKAGFKTNFIPYLRHSTWTLGHLIIFPT